MVSVVAFVLILLVIGFLFNLLISKVSSPNRELLEWNCARNATQAELWVLLKLPLLRTFVRLPWALYPRKTRLNFVWFIIYPIPKEIRLMMLFLTIVPLSNITAIKATGEGCFLAKTDIKSAFRIIPIHPADYSLLGMKFDNLYYFDRCLPMGLSSSCNIFEAFEYRIGVVVYSSPGCLICFAHLKRYFVYC